MNLRAIAKQSDQYAKKPSPVEMATDGTRLFCPAAEQ
jgi:hypothetical protein